VARWFRSGIACGRPFRLPVPQCPAVLRLHTPLIKLDVRISRIQLSDKAVFSCDTHTFAHEPLRLVSGKLVEFQLSV